MPSNPARDARTRRYVYLSTRSLGLNLLLSVVPETSSTYLAYPPSLLWNAPSDPLSSSTLSQTVLHKHTSLNPFIHSSTSPLLLTSISHSAHSKLTWYPPFSQTSGPSSQPSLIHLQTSNRPKPKPKPHNNKRNNSYKPSSNNRICRTSSLCNR